MSDDWRDEARLDAPRRPDYVQAECSCGHCFSWAVRWTEETDMWGWRVMVPELTLSLVEGPDGPTDDWDSGCEAEAAGAVELELAQWG